MTDAERQTAYHESIWNPAQRKRTEYWQSMWERSMHNPLNKKPSVPEGRISPNASVHHGDVDEFTHPNTPPPRTAWSKDPWPDARGSLTPPNAPCCKTVEFEGDPRECAFTDKDLSILTEAQNLVYGARQRAYGHPAVDFSRTAALISILLASKLSRDLGPEDVATIMVCVKLSREANEHGRDNLVDAAGYLECLSRVKRFTAPLSSTT